MRIGWHEIGAASADDADGRTVELRGFPVDVAQESQADRFLLVAEAPCCPGCAPREAGGSVEVSSVYPLPMRSGALRLGGTWRVSRDHGGSVRYRLTDARPLDVPGFPGLSRRRMLAAAPLVCLAACTNAVASEDVRRVVESGPAIDLHSHAGGIASVNRVRTGIGFSPIAAPMRVGGMAATCLAVVSDGPTHKVMEDRRIRPFRDPVPGELYDYGRAAFNRLHEIARSEGLAIIADAAAMRAAKAGVPSIIVSAEGADFLEGRLDRVDEAYQTWKLRHLQLTHYRVNELGDIQTEAPVHGGLTDFGAEVVRRCNRLGIVVDVAHGPLDLVKRAAEVTTKPLVLSHTALSTKPGLRSRLVTREHAMVVSGTGGVIGIWPPAASFPTMDALAAGMARMVDAVGVDHVGLGSDMRGLVGPSIFPDYDRLPALAEALLKAGFSAPDTMKILGGNYARVFQACVS